MHVKKKNKRSIATQDFFFEAKSLATSGSNRLHFRHWFFFFSKKVSSLTPSCCRCQTDGVMSAKNQSIHQQNSIMPMRNELRSRWQDNYRGGPSFHVRTLYVPFSNTNPWVPSMGLCGTWIVSLFVSQSSPKTDIRNGASLGLFSCRLYWDAVGGERWGFLQQISETIVHRKARHTKYFLAVQRIPKKKQIF